MALLADEIATDIDVRMVDDGEVWAGLPTNESNIDTAFSEGRYTGDRAAMGRD